MTSTQTEMKGLTGYDHIKQFEVGQHYHLHEFWAAGYTEVETKSGFEMSEPKIRRLRNQGETFIVHGDIANLKVISYFNSSKRRALENSLAN